jgi:hypothetical protein
MSPLIHIWLDARAAVAAASLHARTCEAAAEAAPLPANLRPATAADLVNVGQVVWYPSWDDRKWCVVEEIEHYGDLWKAFTAHDGNRYGLDGAFIEI